MHAKRFHLCGVTSYFFTLLMTNVVQRFLHCIKSVPRFLAVTPPTNNKKNKSHLTVWPSSGACVATISLFSETSNEEFSNTCNGKPAVLEEL